MCIRDSGYTVLHDIGGHGVGNDFHEEPYVCHIGKKGTGMLLVPGMVFTIEPMVNEGEEDFFQDEENGWTIYTEAVSYTHLDVYKRQHHDPVELPAGTAGCISGVLHYGTAAVFLPAASGSMDLVCRQRQNQGFHATGTLAAH